jgi:hypothetical protein
MGYFPFDIDSVKIVEEKNRMQSIEHGRRGASDASEVGGKSSLGESGERRGIRLIMTCVRLVFSRDSNDNRES